MCVSGYIACFQCRLKAGTAWNVISVIIPRAPRERSAARNKGRFLVGEQRIVREFESVMRKLIIEVERTLWYRVEP